MVITDRTLALPRTIDEVVAAALRGGATAIQLRDKSASARALHQDASRLLRLTRDAGALLIVNDRLDVALATGADGVHLGPDDLSIAAARRLAPSSFIIGASTDDPVRASDAVAQGADYIGCGAVFSTTSKDVGDEAIGPGTVDAVATAIPVPVVAIGGIGPANVHQLTVTRAAGVAVLSSVMAAPDPEATCRALRRAFSRP